MSSSFNLYHLTLQPPTAISNAVVGNFSSASSHEFVVSRGSFLEILQRDSSNRLQTVYREQAFGSIRSLGKLRLSGHHRDLIVLSSDSGRLTMLKFTGREFEKLYCETYGKSGMRRTAPGEYVASDPAGRAIMIAAIEKDKFVFATNRDAQDQLYVSSPLEAHKSSAVTFAVVGLDVGYDNPIFAALEASYEEEDPNKKLIVFYEVDLGLNHVVRKWSKVVQSTANSLIAVPKGGVVVCYEDGIEFVKPNQEKPLMLNFPKRQFDDPSRKVYTISSACFQTKSVFFALLQTERGDLFKLTVDDKEMTLKYFDTVTPANQLCISNDGLLFVASEFGSHQLYQFRSIGDSPDDDSLEFSTSSPTQLRTFIPRNEPLNLDLFDVQKSLCPIVSFKVADLAKDAGVQQIYALSGRAEQACLKNIRQGIALSEMGNLRLPAKAEACRGVWTIRKEESDRFILVSFQESTKVFSARTEEVDGKISDVIEEDNKTPFAHDSATICASAWGKSEVIQVTSFGWRRISYEKNQIISEYKCSSQKRVEVAACNPKQICIGLTGGELIYFEADQAGVPQEQRKHDVGLDIACIDCDTNFLAIGCWDASVRILSLEKSNRMAALSSQKIPAKPHSIALVKDKDHLRLEVGLQNGVLVRSVLDTGSSGALIETRSHVLGSKPVKVQRIYLNVNDKVEQACLCCSTRVWLARSSTTPSPLSYRSFEFAAPFKSASFQGKEGMVMLGPKNLLSITTFEGYGLDPNQRFNEESFKLDRTPRRMVKHPTKSDLVILIEGDRDSFTSTGSRSNAMDGSDQTMKKIKKEADDMDVDEDEDVSPVVFENEHDVSSDLGRKVGYPKQKDPDASWGSCVRVISPLTGQTLQRIQLDKNEMAVSLEHCRFNSEDYLLVGTVTGMTFHPRSQESCSIRTYKFLPSGGKLESIHQTKCDEIPLALAFFDGKLLCGAGGSITLYELGQKQLLRKSELKGLPSLVSFIKVISSDRFLVGDSHESVYFVSYSKQDNSFSVFADDVMTRMCTAGDVVDPNTCASGDKFGNIFVLRLPNGATGSDPKSRAMQARTSLWDQGHLGGAPHKLDLLAHFYVGEVVTAIQKCCLAPGRSEVLLYGTVLGTIGCMMPFGSRDDLDFFSHLEIHLRKHYKNILGRDHLQYRSYFTPVKSVIDGDLCETYFRLPEDTKTKIAKEMDRTVEEICRRLEEVRGNVLW